MSDTLTGTEQQAVDETRRKIAELRAESQRRLAEERRNPKVVKRRRENLLRRYQESLTAG
ncbi:DNA gyrase/topoisomerase IV subunit A [Naumannella cuiyingiana]|uniref:DNA gyrase/topoisomerase IV subunit A n=1 Tax=Naumannella cuiyingiana TaxID=1347891 RepID=A0A7Z0IMA1_9ACTN|nr:hypothetical protein [Naumannella cuiyingiana]NYI72367.1 DNA gyrase/topoisomerase IV subunit A [Naumannella cuiyingiana]